MSKPVVAVVFTRQSPCRCADAWSAAIEACGLEPLRIPVEELSASRPALATAALVIEYADTYRGRGEFRPLVRHQLASWGARLVGASAEAAQASDDKIEARIRLERAGLAVAPGRVVTRAGLRGAAEWSFPAVLKRPFEHGSRGVARVRTAKAARAAAAKLFAKGDPAILVEAYVEGREISLSVIETVEGPRCLPPVEIVLPRGEIYSRRRKSAPGGPPLRAAEFSEPEAGLLRMAALSAFRGLGLAGLARFDLRIGEGGPVFLEANARPSVEPGLDLPFAAGLAGLPFREVARLVLQAAARRHGQGDLARRLEPSAGQAVAPGA